MLIGGLFFFFCIEKYKVLLFKKYFISIFLSIVAIVFVIFLFIDILLTQTLSNIVMPIFLIFFLKGLIQSLGLFYGELAAMNSNIYLKLFDMSILIFLFIATLKR